MVPFVYGASMGFVAMTRARVFLAGIAVFAAIAVSSPSMASERRNFVDKGAEKLTTKQLTELFSDSRFLGSGFSVTNLANGTRVFEAKSYLLKLRWWVDAAGRFCTDTRSGMELCGIEYYLRKDRLKIFNGAGDVVQEFVVKR